MDEEKLTGQVLVKLKPSDAERFRRASTDRGVKAGNLARAVLLAWLEAVERGTMSAGKISFVAPDPARRYPEADERPLLVAEASPQPKRKRRIALGARGGRRG